MRRLHLIIVSYPSRLDATLEEIARTLAQGTNEERVVARAQAHSDVRYLVRLWHLRQREVHTLDLVGHGDGGRFKLGDELLFGGDGAGLELVEAWKPFLSERATLRLLGCAVGGRRGTKDGKKLLAELDARLGGRRRALAPTRALFTIDYGAGGLSPRAERSLAGSRSISRRQ